jgi:hypothetical protein
MNSKEDKTPSKERLCNIKVEISICLNHRWQTSSHAIRRLIVLEWFVKLLQTVRSIWKESYTLQLTLMLILGVYPLNIRELTPIQVKS